MRFTFIHAADLHIDSPFASLGSKSSDVAARFAKAGRDAVHALIKETIDSDAAFLIIAGDIFDRDWKDVTTGLFFVNAIGELHRAGIPTILVRGNHDAEGVISQSLTYPDTVHSFASNKAHTIALDQYRVALHGRSFGARKVTADFLSSYPARREGWLNIGVLHTGLDGSRGHESYAPCTVEDLTRFGYDYWALGHIHAGEIVSRDPWVVYPGILQGRSVRETGAKGAVRVTVEDGRIVDVTPVVLDSARWAHDEVDLTGSPDIADVLERIGKVIGAAHDQVEGRALAIRLTLRGTTALHDQLIARSEMLRDEARAIGFQYAGDCWVEQVKIATKPQPIEAEDIGAEEVLNIKALLNAAAGDEAFIASVGELLASVQDKLPRELREAYDEDRDAVIRDFAAMAHAHLAGSLSS